MGFITKEIPYTLKIGRDLNSVSNLPQAIRDQENDFDFIMVDIAHNQNFKTEKTILSRDIALTRSDTSVKSQDWQEYILAKINNYLVDCDSKYEHVRLRSEAIVIQEINFAMHCAVQAIVLDFPLNSRIENFARIINQYLQNVHNASKFIFKIVVPGQFDDAETVYNNFITFKQLCGHHTTIQVILELQADLPHWEYFLQRWTSERVYAIYLNVNGFPVLSKKHQTVVKEFMKQQVKMILRARHPNDDIEQYKQFICHLFKTHDVLDEEEKIEVNYRNYLQSPLQPLADNLESQTYETFENDTIKYDLYEESLYKAFLDKKKYGKFLQTQKKDQQNNAQLMECDFNEEITVMYFGAGRGPLIRKAVRAADKAKVKIKIIALDKNPNAIVTLRNMIIDEKLEDRVSLFAGDMRKIDIKDLQGDIILSELLGSFGDNELSPECLIPTEKFLKQGGIYIPYSYTNYVLPLSSQIIWNEVNLYVQQGLSAKVPINQQLFPFELPYVVKIYSACYPCGLKPQPVFTFRHLPYPDNEDLKNLPQGEDQSMKMFDRITFTCEAEQSEIHGFGGFFTAELYQDVFYSTNPTTHTPGMHSWFPLYFPVAEPFLIFKDQQVSINIWRNNSQQKVWYEWSMSVFDTNLNKLIMTTHIHNSNGRGFSIGL